MRRRDFLKNSSLVSAAALLPQFLRATQAPHWENATHGKVLVVIQFSGGNDGLNTFVPFEQDAYYQNRPGIGIPKADLLSLDRGLGLHPSLLPLKECYDQGFMSLINSVGYPNPNRSHFRSMDIWQSASDAHEYRQTGWIGRLLDAQCPDRCASPAEALEIDDTLSLALKGQQVKGLAVKNPQALYNTTQEPYLQALARQKPELPQSHPTLSYLHKTLVEATSSAEYVYTQSKVYASSVAYPADAFAQRLKTIAQLIVANTRTRVYYLTLAGFDTHVNQLGAHANLLSRYAKAMAAFIKDLRLNHRFQDVMIMTFSEFGRRVKQNASRGTDHGTASNVSLISGKLKQAGVYNEAADLSKLEAGDLRFTVDFRQIYATLLEQWLETPAEPILGKNFALLDMV